MRIALILLLATSCATRARLVPPPVALPQYRHGHRIEALPDGYLCFGGFASGEADRGQKATSFLPTGATSWQPRQPLRHPHSFFASTVIDGAVYAIGAAVERYDQEQDRWHVVVPPGTLPRSHFGAAAVGNQIFVLGGFPKVGTGFHAIDVRTGIVREAQPPPHFQHGDHLHYVCELRGELHVFGGIDGEVSEMHTEHWVRRNDEWHQMPDCPEGLWTKFAAHTVLGDKLYLFSDAGSFRYDPTDNSWLPLATPPAIAAMPVAVHNGTDIYVIGGMQVDRRTHIFWRYDPGTDEFCEVPGTE